MKKQNLNKDFVRLVVIAIFVIFLTTSANSAFISNTTKIKDFYTPPFELLGDNYYVWKDDFNNEQKIDITKSWGYVVEGGVAKMKNTYSVWTDPSWEKLKPISVTNSGGALTDFALNFIVEYDSDMQPDYDDIRFKHENTPTNFLDYWIESYDSTEASVWVKIPNLPSGSSKMYLFYSNPDANSESDFGEVFDDWEEKWANDEMLSACDPNWEGVWDPDISYTNNQFLVAWEEGEAYYGFPYNKGYKQEIRASMFSPDGTETVHDKLIYSDKNSYTYFRNEDPSIANNGGSKFAVAWEHWAPTNSPYSPQPITTMDIYARTVQKSGSSFDLGSLVKICEASNCQADPVVVYDSENNHFIVIWEDARSGTSEYDIWGTVCDENLNVISEKIICGDSLSQCEPWAAYDPINSQIFVVWEEGVGPANGPFKIMGGIFDDSLNAISQFTVAAPDNYPNDDIDYNFPCVEFDEDSERYLVTWNDGDISDNDWWGDIWGKIYDESGNIKVNQFLIKSGEYVRTEIVPYLTDSFFVSYDNNYKIYGRLVTYEGDLLGDDIKLSAGPAAHADWASMATDGSKIFVTWEDLRIEKPQIFDDYYPDAFGNIWNLNIPDGSDISITWGQEKEIILEAQITSKEIEPSNLNNWHMFEVGYAGTITFDILDATATNILIENASDGEDLSILDPNQYPILRLRAHFTRDKPSYSPTIDWWRILYEGIDQDPPVTRVEYVDGVQGWDPWYTTECVTIWLKAIDYPEDTGSGIKFTYYTVDNGQTQIYDEASGIFLCAYEPDWYGDWEVNFWSEDNTGNVEDKNKQNNFRTIYIDCKKPDITDVTPTEDAEVSVPFEVTAEVTDNAGIKWVDFDIEPFDQRPGLPYVDEQPPYVWICDEQPIPRIRATNPPHTLGLSVQIRVRAFDISGQKDIRSNFITISNWDDSATKVMIYNYKLLFNALKLGIAFDNKLSLSMNNLKNADSVKFVATKLLTGKQISIWDNDFSDGISANFDIPTGLYRLMATSYYNGDEVAYNLISWVLFVKI
ncbi:MAG: DUF2341 domain-containing protein [Candidatus Dadabacteria bacterium]|nr:DUF2341 domain-containing protein [Candidatus Dadabacteria bacterium]